MTRFNTYQTEFNEKLSTKATSKSLKTAIKSIDYKIEDIKGKFNKKIDNL